ncbi:plasmid mobilization protein [Mediterraneibacter gnavus]|nr:hypothetical protein [Mediterraneibacter gnavus]MCZ7692870.1 hypothetical protein [Mediterraneibacter gnavus]MCZ7734512.1 hypothetical protein [Mediterraneibacter gnavus]MDC6146085.1 hypothetical protein [Mediterraneibacter gnavus]MDE1199502.1 hypothetical protein [Mediterraneibacter gnavus]PLT57013.1 hypothetical protein CDL22_02210 [Mediterraneibacter gnavus]
MSGLDHNRKRNQTICFRATPEERKEIEARIKVSGMPKGEYCRQSLLNQKIEINAGKYQSDRLSIEIKRLRELTEQIPQEQFQDLLQEIKILLKQLISILNDNYELKR